MARTASYILDSVWKKVDVLSFDRSCFNFTSINIKSFFQIYNAILVGAPDYALHQLHMRCQFFAPPRMVRGSNLSQKICLGTEVALKI